MNYGVRCEKIAEATHPNERLCYIESFSKDGIQEGTLQVIVGQNSVRYVKEVPYMEVGVIPPQGRMPHRKLDEDKGIFLIEFPQEALNGSWRTWIQESDLIELAEQPF